MGKIMMNSVPYASTYDNATSVKYSNTKSQLEASNVQDALDALNNIIEIMKNKMSHVGSIIYSTTLDTMEKVVKFYGGIKWERIEGKFLLGASEDYLVGTLGGEEEVVLTTNQMPKHTHGMPHGYIGTTPAEINISFSDSMKTGTYQLTTSTGDNQPHNNMPPYEVVYIWKRIE